MARQLRLEYEGAIYHVTVRGNDRRDIFLDDEDRKYLLSRLSECIDVCGVRLYVFCLMSNHFHLVLETPRANLSSFMQKVLTGFTVHFNCRHQRSGHVTQGRYSARLVSGDQYLLKLSRYVHLNPIKIKKMASWSKQEKVGYLRSYSWSSYRSYAGGTKEFPFVEYGPMLSLLGGRKKDRQKQYRKFVEEMVEGEDEEFIGELWRSSRSIGDEKFREWVDTCYAEEVSKRESREDISFRKVDKQGLSAKAVLDAVAKELKIDKDLLHRRSRNSIYRGIAGLMLCKYAGYNQRQVAKELGLNTGAAVSFQLTKVKVETNRNELLAKAVAKLDRALDRKRKK